MFDIDNEEDKNELKFYIKTLDGISTLFQVTKDTKIEDFTKKYRKDKGFSKCTQVAFCYKGQKLAQSKTFGDYQIEQEATLHEIIMLSGC